jgi:hypothetical protein
MYSNASCGSLVIEDCDADYECWDGSLVCDESDCPDEPVAWDGDPCSMPDNSLHLTDEGEIYFNASEDIGGFQFNVDGATVSGASNGAAADAGFTISTSASTVLGFSFTGAVVPAGCGTLTELSLNGDATGLSGIVISDPAGSAIDFEYFEADIVENDFAYVQVIHNSASPTVDIYLDGGLAVEDFAYRTATPVLELPTSFTVGIAPAGGNIIAEFPFELEADGSYVVVATGLLGDDATPFDLAAAGTTFGASSDDLVGLEVYHGSTDAPAVDIWADDAPLLTDFSYGDFSGFVEVPAADYTLGVAPAGGDIIAAFTAPLSGLGGGSAVAFASGFLSGDDPAFGLFAALADGTVLELPALAQDCAGDWGGTAVEDCLGECNGDAVEDVCGVCEGSSTDISECDESAFGCTDESACNYDSDAAIDDGSCLYACAPLITSISDVPNDQGGRVYLTFSASDYDTNAPERDQLYTVERQDAGVWVVVMSGAGYGAEEYTYEVSTLYNQTDEMSGITNFRVIAAMEQGTWISDIGEGTSIDNIAPSAPADLMADVDNELNSVSLSWEASNDFDFDVYEIYKNDIFLAATSETMYFDEDVDQSQDWTYSIYAVDVNGNMSEASIQEVMSEALDNDEIAGPGSFMLHDCYPNPFNPKANISFDVPSYSKVMLSIYNTRGVLVQELVNDFMSPGNYVMTWDAEGYSSGVYFVRMVSEGYVESQKIMLVK